MPLGNPFGYLRQPDAPPLPPPLDPALVTEPTPELLDHIRLMQQIAKVDPLRERVPSTWTTTLEEWQRLFDEARGKAVDISWQNAQEAETFQMQNPAQDWMQMGSPFLGLQPSAAPVGLR